jgi:hypothetical protein
MLFPIVFSAPYGAYLDARGKHKWASEFHDRATSEAQLGKSARRKAPAVAFLKEEQLCALLRNRRRWSYSQAAGLQIST